MYIVTFNSTDGVNQWLTNSWSYGFSNRAAVDETIKAFKEHLISIGYASEIIEEIDIEVKHDILRKEPVTTFK